MPDYLYVPNVNNVFTEGTPIFSYPDTGETKVGNVSGVANSIKVGCYNGNNGTVFVFSSSSIINNTDIRMVSPYDVVIRTVTQITTSYENGYYVEVDFSVAPNYGEIEVTVFNDLSSLLDAFDNIAPPSPTSGIVVTALASPISPIPSDNGVIVHVIGRLLDPNTQGGTSETGGGQGIFDDTSDIVPVPLIPFISATESGLCALYRPTQTQLKSLARYLWTNITDFIENVNKLFANPMDYLIALNILPCRPDVGENKIIRIGSWTTTIEMPPVNSQWYELDCGKIDIREYWGSALDYAPNTKISLFLPFIGSVTLNTDEVMNKRLGVVYRIDLLSGQCVAMVTVSGFDQTDTVYYQYTGECAVSIPLTGADWSRIYSAALGAIGTGITGGIAAGAAGAAAGGATSALAGAQAADAASNAGLAYSMINDTSKGVRGVAQMREQMVQASQMALDAGKQAASAPARVANGIRAVRIANTVNNVIGTVMSGKFMPQHSGAISGSAGMLGVKNPYVLIEYPRQSLAENYKHFVGYPSNMYARLGDLTGYTECEQVIANGLVNQTDAEMAEIIEALKGGVYL